MSAERVVCGAGLPAIYDFLRPRAAQAEPLDLFIDCYGAFAGDIALAFLARGGLLGSLGAAQATAEESL